MNANPEERAEIVEDLDQEVVIDATSVTRKLTL